MQLDLRRSFVAHRQALPCVSWSLPRLPREPRPAGSLSERKLAKSFSTAAKGRPRKADSSASQTTSKRRQPAKQAESVTSKGAEQNGDTAGSEPAQASGIEPEQSDGEAEVVDQLDSSQPSEATEDQEVAESDPLDAGEEDPLDELQGEEDENLAILEVLSDEELESRQYQDGGFLPTTRTSPLLTNREVRIDPEPLGMVSQPFSARSPLSCLINAYIMLLLQLPSALQI